MHRRRIAQEDPLAPTGGEGWGEGARGGRRATDSAQAPSPGSPSGLATLSRGAGEGFAPASSWVNFNNALQPLDQRFELGGGADRDCHQLAVDTLREAREDAAGAQFDDL